MHKKHMNKQVKDVILTRSYPPSLFLIFDDGSRQGIMVGERNLQIENSVLETISKILSEWGEIKRVEIAQSYMENERQFPIFLTELVALSFYITNTANSWDLMKINNANDLMHNRIVAQLLYEYTRLGDSVKLSVSKQRNNKTPDFDINGIYAEVKTILSIGKLEETLNGVRLTDESYKWFQRKLEEEFKNAKQQVGEKGIIILAPWSYKIDSVLRQVFEKELSIIPPYPERGIVILILYGNSPLEYNYLKFTLDNFKSSINYVLSEIQIGVKLNVQYRSFPIALTLSSTFGHDIL
ncbi:MAG: hypothetical protein AUI60_02865 [Thaumarchaeota archaeon 13_1_40CM_2_39_4]|nr:MAG: hypothetical protein AUI60_02865 [Thaumarchaeota archaeon 13_1_40CM_2_39_4]